MMELTVAVYPDFISVINGFEELVLGKQNKLGQICYSPLSDATWI